MNLDIFTDDLVEASNMYKDEELTSVITSFLNVVEAKKEKENHGKRATRLFVYGQHGKGKAPSGSESGFIGSAGIGAGAAAGAVVGEAGTRALMNGIKHASSSTLNALIKAASSESAGRMKPYAKGAGVTALGLAAIELLRRRRARKKAEKSGK